MQWTCVQLSGESSGLLEKEVVLATSATPCARVALGQTGLQKAGGQLTYQYIGAKPSIKPLQIRDEFLTTPRKTLLQSIQQQGQVSALESTQTAANALVLSSAWWRKRRITWVGDRQMLWPVYLLELSGRAKPSGHNPSRPRRLASASL
jgi:hypothetical protein